MSQHLTEEQLRAHPELACLLGLATLLEVVPASLIAVHASGPAGPLQDQARSMIRVSRVLADQVSAYVGLLESVEPRRRTA